MLFKKTEEKEKVRSKEDIYDQEVIPLLKKLSETCKQADITVFGMFDLTEDRKQGMGKLASCHFGNAEKRSVFMGLAHLVHQEHGLELLNKIGMSIKMVEKSGGKISGIDAFAVPSKDTDTFVVGSETMRRDN